MTVLAAVLIVLVQAVTGASWWAVLRRRSTVSVLELLGMGLALGTFTAMLAGVLLVGTPLSGVSWLVPAAVAMAVLLWAVTSGRMSSFRIVAPARESLAGALGLVAGLALVVVNARRIPLSAPSTDSFTDLYFFEALSRGLAEFGPGQSILMTGGSLRYHWFTYAWAGDLAQGAGTAPFVVISRVLPIVTLVGVGAIVIAWAARLSRVRWVPALAVLLVVVGGYVGALYGSVLNFDSPSQAMSTLWLLGLAVAFLAFVRSHVNGPALAAIAALAVACTGGKVSHALVAAGGIGLVAVVGVLLRTSWWRRALLASLVSAVSMALTYAVVLSGVAVDQNVARSTSVKASTWQGMDPLLGRVGVLLGTAALVLAVVARLGGVAWLLSRRRTRLHPEVLFVSGSLLVGLAAMLLLRQGVNELWFVLAASAPASVLSAVGVGSALRRVRRDHRDDPLRHPLLWAVIISVPASLSCLVLTRNWSSHQAFLNWLAPVSAWLLVPVAATVVVVTIGRRNRSFVHMAALSIAALAIVSILTRPSSIWTAERPTPADAGAQAPTEGLPVDELPDEVIPPDATERAQAYEAIPFEERYEWSLEAADWLASNTDADAVIATSDPVSALVPALTGRQMFIAGQVYQAGLGRADEVNEVATRARDSRQFGFTPSPRTALPLCAGGVDYVWLQGQAPDGLPGEVVFANDGVTVLTLRPTDCG